MNKYIAFIIVPIFVNILLYVLPLKEKGKYGIVTLPKSLFLFFPSTALSVALVALVLNSMSYVQTHDNDFLKTIFIMLVVIVFSVILLCYYFLGKIKYTSEEFIYRGKTYRFSDIETVGTDKDNDYVYVLKSGKKIKVYTLSPGANELFKTYKEFKSH